MAARKCPNCGKQTLYVYGSERRDCGMERTRLTKMQDIGIKHRVIRRRLECDECGHKVITYEIEQEDLDNIRKKLHDIRKKARLSSSVMGRLETAIKHCREDLKRVNDN